MLDIIRALFHFFGPAQISLWVPDFGFWFEDDFPLPGSLLVDLFESVDNFFKGSDFVELEESFLW